MRQQGGQWRGIRGLGLVAAVVIAAGAAHAMAQPGDKKGEQPAGENTTLPQAATTPLAHVEVVGTGPVPVVLIPGLACDWTVYAAFMERNKDRYTMYAVTLPGFGGSAAPPATSDSTDDAWLSNAERAVAALIEERKLVKPLIVGHSLGGHLAFRLSTLGPDKIRGVVAIDGMPAFPIAAPGTQTKPEDRKKMAGMMGQQMLAMPKDAWVEQQKSWFASMVKDKDRAVQIGEMSAKVSQDITVRYMAELMASDVTERARGAKVPMLAVAAVDGGAGQAQMVRAVWNSIGQDLPALQVVYFEDTRHFVMDDAPAELDAAIADFVAGKPPKGKPATTPAPGAKEQGK